MDEQNRAMEYAVENSRYAGTIQSPVLSGEVQMTILKDGLWIDAVFDQQVISYADIESISIHDFAVQIHTPDGDTEISRMRQSCEWFFQALLEAYNGKVLSALHVENKPDFSCKGQFRFGEIQGTAVIQVFEDCLCVLPPNKNARRVPFVFLKELKKETYALTLWLTTGEQFAFSMLGHVLEPLEK